MSIVLCVVSAAFGGLSLLASVIQMKKGKKRIRSFIMAAGSVLLLAAVVFNILHFSFDWSFALVGCIAICVAAILNGIKSENFHIQHHIIRGVLSVLLIIGFILL